MSGIQTSYEVQVLQSGNWRIHAQFAENGREDAIEEAVALENMPGVGDIKVIKDEFNTKTHMHAEHIIHKFVSKKRAGESDTEKYSRISRGGRGGDVPDFDVGVPQGRKSSGLGVVTKILLVVLFSLVIASVATGIAEELLPRKKVMGLALYGNMRVNVLFVVFILFFILTTASSIKAFMAKDELDKPTIPSRPKLGGRKAKSKAKAKKSTEQEKQLREDRKEREKKRKKAEEEEASRKAIEEEQKKKDESADEEEKAPEEVAEEEAPEEEPEDMMSANAEQQKALMMSFFGESIRKLPAERKKMDNYNRFGVNLYLAGAAESIGSERSLETEETEKILCESLLVMGMPENNAHVFAKRYEEYLLQDVRYMQMFQSGRTDMSNYLDGQGESALRLEEGMDEWNKPKEPENPEKQTVVMFTDIVGSTAMTHEKGNLGAQEVVRAHNKVVREALSKFRGHEIKHTGDGIMASFEDVTDSLNSTAHMQRLIQIHNQNQSDVPLKVKIGIAMGSVVVEENDLYGVTVQMAARIVDKGSEGMILVSDTVYGMLKGGKLQFIKRGPYLMKGIDGPASLYELIWDDKADVAALEAKAETDNRILAASAQIAAQPAALPAGPAVTPET